MLKIILADDEPKVLLLIKNLIRWDEIGIQIVGEATDGVEAYNLIQTHHPDIVITDIRMPGMSGLDIIGKTREIGLRTSFIVISGYKHFEYAQSALKFGVEDYLVKPINRQELTNTLIKLRDRRLEHSDRLETEQIMRSQLEQSRAVLRKRFIDVLIFEPDQLPKQGLKQINSEFQLDLQDELFQVLNIKLDKKNPGIEDTTLISALDQIPAIIAAFFSKHCHEIITIRVGYSIVCLLNFPRKSPDLIKKQVKLLYDQINKHLEPFDYFDLTIGVGSVVDHFLDIKNSIAAAADSVESRIVLGVGRVIDISNYDFKSIPLQTIIPPETEQQFFHLLEIFDIGGIKLWIETVFAKANTKKETNPVILYHLSRHIIALFFDGIKRFNIHGAGDLPQQAVVYRNLDNTRSVPEVKGYVLEIILGYLDTHLQSKHLQDTTPIRIAKQYVTTHFQEQISLEDIARLVSLNPVYFSVVFKKETGINFSDYLINVRLEAAKKLLKETRLNLTEIAEQVGYRDPKYFSKLFSKVVGIKPQEYRKLYA